jgi:hypothetical protein
MSINKINRFIQSTYIFGAAYNGIKLCRVINITTMNFTRSRNQLYPHIKPLWKAYYLLIMLHELVNTTAWMTSAKGLLGWHRFLSKNDKQAFSY